MLLFFHKILLFQQPNHSIKKGLDIVGRVS